MYDALLIATASIKNDFLGITLSLIFLSFFMAAAEAWHYFFKPKVEWTRKLVHAGSGVVVASFPWLLKSTYSVVLIAIIMFAIMTITKKLKLLQSIHSVSRKSYGDVFYLAAVIALFLICQHNKAYYFAAILTLAVADAMAAVIGSTYHKITFSVEANQKSFEGSAIFFLSTFLTVHLPLLLISDLPKDMTVLIALQIAIVVTLIEAIAINGFDNFAIPLSVYFLLVKLDDKTISYIITQIIAQILLIVAMIIFCKRFKYFSFSAGIVGHLFLFSCYSLGGPLWLVPALLSLIVFGRWRRRSDRKQDRTVARYQMTAAAYVCFAPISVIFINNILMTFFKLEGRLMDHQIFFALYIGVLCASVSLSLVTLRRSFKKIGGPIREQARILLCTTAFTFVTIAPISLVLSGFGASIFHWLCALGFAFITPFIHLLFWNQKANHTLSYLGFQAVSLSFCTVISSSILVVLNF